MPTKESYKIIVLGDSSPGREIMLMILEDLGCPAKALHGQGPQSNEGGKTFLFPLDSFRQDMDGVDFLIWLQGTSRVSNALILKITDFMLKDTWNPKHCMQEI